MKKIYKILLMLLVMAIISVVFFLILLGFKVFVFENGDLQFNFEILQEIRDRVSLYAIFLAIQIPTTIMLCFIPATNTIFISVAIALFGANWRCFLVVVIGQIITQICLDLIGRNGGYKIAKKLVGEQEINKITDLISKKGYTYLPILYLTPILNCDFICIVAGMSRISFVFHLISIVVCKLIGNAVIIFGLNIMPKDLFLPFSVDKIYNYIILGGVLISYISVIWKLSRVIDKKVSAYLDKKRGKANE